MSKNDSRRAHLAEYRAWAARIDSVIPGYTLSGFKWRSWIRHPISNLHHRFWTLLPHRPKWEMGEYTFGAVGHDSRVDADGGSAYDRCTRCGLKANERGYA